jgi:hypothetical protein
MSIVNTTYFQQGTLLIPNNDNIVVQVPGVPNSGSDLQFFIDIYERYLLINALGITLYNELQAALLLLPFNEEATETAPQKWIDLVNGKDYTISGKSYRWDGLTGMNSQSLIAFYIYCQYLRNNQSIYTTGGVVLTDSANSINVDPTPKYIFSYNNFVNKYQGELSDCYNRNNNPNIIINTSGNVGLDYYGKRENNFSNLYQYLTDQNTLDPTSFPDFNLHFKFYYRENTFGI